MEYRQQEASGDIRRFVRSYWMVDSRGKDDVEQEKIIPDGFPELIVHYGDPFKINLGGQWELQEKQLLAGQISNHFHLENTGVSGVFGMKLQPYTLTCLFNLNMKSLRDRVIGIPKDISATLGPLLYMAVAEAPFETKTEAMDQWWAKFLSGFHAREAAGEKAVHKILDSQGAAGIGDLLKETGTSERSLERYFETHVGVSPKFYSRIIRFSNVFKLVQQPGFNWSDVSYLAGFYDQSHFIRNFKEFTGEEPSRYEFDQSNMANMFLR